MNRKEVYKLIDGERDYQDILPETRTDGNQRSVGDYITMMGYYYNKMVEAWTQNPGDEQALDVMRKIGGIAVHCMEDHGAPARIVTGAASIKIKKMKPKKLIKKSSNHPSAAPWPFPFPQNS